MIDNRIVITKDKIETLEAKTENAGLRMAWNFIRNKILRTSKLATIIFQDQSVLDSRGIGGFFTQNSLVDVLYLSKDLYDKTENKLDLTDEKSAAIFLHECCHYIHIVCNAGVFKQRDVEEVKSLKATFPISQQVAYWAEREAWQLSLNMNELFRINMKELIDEVNAVNMINVEITHGLRKSMGKQAVKRWSQKLHIEDFKHVKSV